MSNQSLEVSLENTFYWLLGLVLVIIVSHFVVHGSWYVLHFGLGLGELKVQLTE